MSNLIVPLVFNGRKIYPHEIFEKDQILSLTEVEKLLGKKLAITSSEYSANHITVRMVTPDFIQTEYEWAATQQARFKGFNNLQQEWDAMLPISNLESLKKRFLLIDKDGSRIAIAEKNPYEQNLIFFGSDEDRYIYFIEL